MKLLVVGDGPRDEHILPPLIQGILDRTIEARYTTWKDIRLAALPHGKRARGLTRKMTYVLTQVRTRGEDGVAAVVDRDRAPARERLNELRTAIEQAPGVRTAIGEANPHVEAWLIDDPKAVRDSLRLAVDHDIPTPAGCEPKRVLSELCQASPAWSVVGSELPLLKRVAGAVRRERCNHRHETGFEEFHRELQSAFAAP